MPDLAFEDFAEGQSLAFGDYVVTHDDVIAFAREFDPQLFHLDEDAGRDSLLGGLAASGWHVCAIGMRMIFEGFLHRSASLGAPGIDEVRWLKPVRPGDRLRIDGVVTAVRVSRSRPDRGIVSFAFTMHNQNQVAVMQQSNSIMLGRRAGAAA